MMGWKKDEGLSVRRRREFFLGEHNSHGRSYTTQVKGPVLPVV